MKAVIDNGKDSLKIEVDNTYKIYPSKIEEGVPVYNEENIFYNGKSYIIGEEAESYNYSVTKSNLHHKLMLYYSLAKITDEIKIFDLVIGCPVTTYLNRDSHDKYVDYIRNDGQPIEIMYNNSKKVIIIESVTLVPETLGGYILDYEISKNELRGVVDIGGLNINGGMYNRGNPIKNKMFTDNLGIHILIDNIQKSILEKREELIDLDTCRSLLRYRDFKDKTLEVIFHNECIKHVKTIKKLLIKKGWNLTETNLRFIGGGSILLKDYIKEEFSQYDIKIEDDVFANCKAFGKFAEKKNAKN